MSESPVETLEKARGLPLFWTGHLTSLWHLKRCADFNASKVDDAWLFVKIERKPNKTVPTIRGAWPPASPWEDTVLSCQAYFRFLKCPSWRNRSPVFAEQSRVSNGHPRRNSRIHSRCRPQIEKTQWDFHLAARWGRITLHCVQRNSVIPIKHIKSLDFLDTTPENPQENCHKTRRTLMSPQECKLNWCTRNQLKMKCISPALASSPSPFPHRKQQVAWRPIGKSRDSLRNPSQV